MTGIVSSIIVLPANVPTPTDCSICYIQSVRDKKNDIEEIEKKDIIRRRDGEIDRCVRVLHTTFCCTSTRLGPRQLTKIMVASGNAPNTGNTNPPINPGSNI